MRSLFINEGLTYLSRDFPLSKIFINVELFGIKFFFYHLSDILPKKRTWTFYSKCTLVLSKLIIIIKCLIFNISEVVLYKRFIAIMAFIINVKCLLKEFWVHQHKLHKTACNSCNKYNFHFNCNFAISAAIVVIANIATLHNVSYEQKIFEDITKLSQKP